MTAVRILALLIIALLPAQGAGAQEFPNKPVRFIVPYAAGGSGDLLARLLGDKLGKLWGQQVVVDNKPGAGGLIGTEAAAHDPDGTTIYLATDGPLTIAPTLHKKPLSYDWKKDFVPLSMMAVGYQILVASPTCCRDDEPQRVRGARHKDPASTTSPPSGRQRAAHGRRVAHCRLPTSSLTMYLLIAARRSRPSPR